MKLTNFAVLDSDFATVTNGEITYQSRKEGTEEEMKEARERSAHVRSDQSFSNGTIRFKFRTNTVESGFLLKLALNTSEESYLAVGHSKFIKKFVIATEFGAKPSNSVMVGNLSSYELNQEHEISINVDGSKISLFVNKILLGSADHEIRESPVTFKLSSNDWIRISDVHIERKQQKAFIVMQFTKEYDELFEDVIKPVCAERNILPVRADEYYSSTPIIKDIIDSIRESSMIIADISPDNPNVFYEIGYSHALGKPTILMCDKRREKLPFDLSSFRTIFYENTIAGKKKVEQALRKYIEVML